MKQITGTIFRFTLLAIILVTWWYVLNAPLSETCNLSVITGGILLTYPVVWLGRKILDRHHSTAHTIRITTFVHFGLAFTFGIPVVRAVSTHNYWSGLTLPVPHVIGLILVIITGTASFLTVLNLAVKGLGAPFFIRFSTRLTADWMYARTRNPMVLAALSLLISLGIWYQSLFFVLWALLLVSPALLFFVKVYEERELELRFGASYLEYKSRTPMLFPRKPGSSK